MPLEPNAELSLLGVVEKLRAGLGENLQSLILYGSAARQDSRTKHSDINLLILLRESTPDAHAAIALGIRGKLVIEPFVLGQKGFERSIRTFAVKFLSIGRHYRVLHGSDPLKGLEIPLSTRRFLTEQGLRNLRLRAARAFILFGSSSRGYARWLTESSAALLTSLSEPPRIEGKAVPDIYADRIPTLESFYDTDCAVLLDVLALKARPRHLSSLEIAELHARIFRLLDRAIHWMENQWPLPENG